MTHPTDARQYAPATQRNREAILDVLTCVLPPQGTVLEIASGTGEHAVFFAPRLHPRAWLPSDPNPLALESIAAWQAQEPAENLYPAIALNVHDRPWPLASGSAAPYPEITAIVTINMIHIAPWEACLALFSGAEQRLATGGVLYLYGPFIEPEKPLAPSNEAFDTSLRLQNPAWGLRSLDQVIAVAHRHHFTLTQTIAMPANNLSVIFQRC